MNNMEILVKENHLIGGICYLKCVALKCVPLSNKKCHVQILVPRDNSGTP